MQHALRVALIALLCGGCGSGMARVKGRLVENGQAKSFPAMAASVEMIPMDAEGKASGQSFTAIVEPDGGFEVVASGGELPPGTYQVAIQTNGRLRRQYQAFAPPNSPFRRELKPGPNEITLDLAKPNE